MKYYNEKSVCLRADTFQFNVDPRRSAPALGERMIHSSYLRNFLTTSLLVVVSFLLIGISFGLVSRNVFLTETRSQVENSSENVSRMAEAYARDGDLRSLELRMTLSTVAASTGEHIFIVSPQGIVISCSDSSVFCEHMGTALDSAVTEALSESERVTFRDELGGMYDTGHYTIASPLRGPRGALLGYLFVSRDTKDALNVWESILPMFVMISLVVLVMALLLSYASSLLLSRPLRAMAEVARRFGQGDMSARAEVPEMSDEISELAEAFNSMADSLEKSEERRREFVANVSHELKTPMTTISGFADGILDGTIPPQSEKRYLQTISSETKRLSRLVRSMLELSKIQSGDRSTLLQQTFDVSEVLRLTLINFMDKREEKRLDVDFQVPEEPMIVMGDPDAITQVVYNLLDNAVKFSKEGTQLGISLWKDTAKAYVSVRNHGATIPEAEIPLLFDRFHKSDRSRSRDRDGVGLGLYIVKTILTSHGEDIAVTSRQGVTDFVFTLTLKR